MRRTIRQARAQASTASFPRDRATEFRTIGADDETTRKIALDPHVSRRGSEHALFPVIDRKTKLGGKIEGAIG